jgi:DNA repair protein RecN (Recombination protein N)
VLSRLNIRNLAVLDEIEFELHEGFNVLTGETGAGKSMLVDALALALGERADSGAVRPGTERAEVTATFTVAAESLAGIWLRTRDLEAGTDCQLRRVITTEGRSRGYINGQPVPLEQLRELGGQLVEICGQHAHQSLLKRPVQREILDAHGGHRPLVEAVAAAHRAWTASDRERHELVAQRRDRQDRQDLLRYQLQELSALNLQDGEVEILEKERLLLANVSRVAAGLSLGLDRLYDAEQASAHDVLGGALRELQPLLALDPALAPAVEMLEQSRIQIVEAADQLRHRLVDLEHDPARLAEIESRLDSTHQLARKHRIEPERLWSLAGVIDAELASLALSDMRLEQIDADCARARAALEEAASRLSAARRKAAHSLGAAVTRNLHSLGMQGSGFSVAVEPLSGGERSVTGADQVEFLVSTNAGQPAGPVSRVASGGELSRVSLAIQVVAMADHGAPTLVFDEVDAGVGGGTAEIVGQCLKQLSNRRQVLCVTHLPQVASQADHHYAVVKSTSAKTTRTAVNEIEAAGRVDEIARMLGGVRITERTRAHAREMLQSARPRRAG